MIPTLTKRDPFMKILALDLGDVWIGTAMSDPLNIIATPYQTVKIEKLFEFLHDLFNKERIEIIVIGYPRTMRDTISEQTKKILLHKDLIEKEFPSKKYILWDERLSSKMAKSIQGKKNKTDGPKEHSIAAAVFLQTYLQFLN